MSPSGQKQPSAVVSSHGSFVPKGDVQEGRLVSFFRRRIKQLLCLFRRATCESDIGIAANRFTMNLCGDPIAERSDARLAHPAPFCE